MGVSKTTVEGSVGNPRRDARDAGDGMAHPTPTFGMLGALHDVHDAARGAAPVPAPRVPAADGRP